MSGPDENQWLAAVRANPSHSSNFAQRWRGLEAQGQDIYGEARMIDAMAPRGSAILDAGCGTGRIGGWLAAKGHQVLGIDLDPHLITVAQEDYPQAQWLAGNLADSEVFDAADGRRQFDLIVSAGNVVTFFSTTERVPSLANLRSVLSPAGRIVIGFGAGRGYEFSQFRQDAKAAGLVIDQEYSTWHLHAPNDEFLVAVLSASTSS